MQIYSFDPGETTGFAIWNLDPDLPPFFLPPTSFGEMDTKQFHRFLDRQHNNGTEEIIYIYEDYLVRIDSRQKGFNHRWNRVIPARVIGAIEFRAYQLGITVVPQQPSIRGIGAGFAGIPHDPNKHDKDHISAMKHGYYYMVNHKLMKPRSLK